MMIDNFKQIEQTIETEEQQAHKIRQIQGILANPVVAVLSEDNHARYYVEGGRGHCLIDIRNSKSPIGNTLNALTIARYPTGKNERIELTNKEIDDLLTILLQWHLKREGDQAAD